MKLGNWRLRRQQVEPTASQVVPALERVREMREHSAWEPVTTPTDIRERGEHVIAARERIRIPPLARERQAGTPPIPWLRESLRPILYGCAALLAFILGFYLLAPEQRPPPPAIEATTMAFRLPDPSAYLTEEEATRFARKALRCLTTDTGDWYLESKRYYDPEQYFRRTTYYEGSIIFRHSIYSSDAITVRVKLDSEEKVIVCTVEPQ